MSSLSSARKRYRADHPKPGDWPRCTKCCKDDMVIHRGDGTPQCMRCNILLEKPA